MQNRILIPDLFVEPLRVEIKDIMIHKLRNDKDRCYIYVIRKIHNAVHNELIRPWRTILGSDTE